MKNQIRLLQIKSMNGTQYKGEVIIDGSIAVSTTAYLNKTNCVRGLNEKIRDYNRIRDMRIPSMKPDGSTIFFELSKSGKATIIQVESPPLPIKTLNEIKQENTITKPVSLPESTLETGNLPNQTGNLPEKTDRLPETQAVQTKTNKLKRKPFTPYGLNGYLVDKNGNVRLMLDRKANAHTIVLEPEMFSSLAEMVKKTQLQNA